MIDLWITKFNWGLVPITVQGSHFFSPNTEFQVFDPKFQGFFKFFVCKIPGTSTQILVIKISKCVKTDAGFPLLLWHKIHCIFQVKAMKSKINLSSNQCLCWLCRYDKEVNQNYFCKWHLEEWSFKHRICQFQVFPGFELKFQVFTTFWANSRHFPGLEKKMTKFQVFQVGWEPCNVTICIQFIVVYN